jgi:hypothetical protein
MGHSAGSPQVRPDPVSQPGLTLMPRNVTVTVKFKKHGSPLCCGSHWNFYCVASEEILGLVLHHFVNSLFSACLRAR